MGKKEKYTIATPCGTICDTCPYYLGEKEPKCNNCKNSAGKPFWGICNVFNCSKKKNAEHCGLCPDFPCEDFINQYDPNKPKGKQEAIFRAGYLAIRAKIGTEKWLERRKDGSLVSFDE